LPIKTFAKEGAVLGENPNLHRENSQSPHRRTSAEI